MFFVMSGFLLSASFERNSDLARYCRNRMTRIYPGLWACLFLTIILFWVIGGQSFLEPGAIPWLIAQMAGLIYTPGFLDDFGYGSYNGSLWTIVVELQFYLVLPIIYIICKKFAKGGSYNKLFYLLFFLSIGLAWTLKASTGFFGGPQSTLSKLIKYSFLPYAYIFMAGILLQRMKVWQWRIIRGKAIFWMGAFLQFKYLVPYHPVADMVGMVMLAICTVSLGYSLPGIATRYLKNNDLSYGVYLYHGMLLSILVELNYTGSIFYFILVAVLTFFLAWLSYRYVESPAMSLTKRKKATPPPAPQQPVIQLPTPQPLSVKPEVVPVTSEVLPVSSELAPPRPEVANARAI
jgi:peptidoglycan/LPS O-acetylase OafA/YrhL